jgi:glycosyltransferase involved in cell wall biosynthesis
MKLLISAYACAPNHGSEHGVGWNWVTEAHRLGHRVWALVSPSNRDAIESACRDDRELAGLHWIFPEVRGWAPSPGIEPKWERTYNLLWQLAALREARQLQDSVEFDAIHHLTWGGVRAPTFLGSLGPPLIVGPLGGGEASPAPLRDGFHFKAKAIEWIRDLSNATITLNPLVRGGLSDAAVIFVRTPDTARLLNGAMREKLVVFSELVLQTAQIGGARAISNGAPRLLYAGRLLYWKGVHIALRALALLVQKMPEARLTIVGSGPEEARLKTEAAAYRVENSVDFIAWLPQPKLFELYASHDLFVFPSLHDSGGYVVLEALSQGLPVICLDLGGPKQIVTPDSGVIVGTAGRGTEQVAAAMAGAIQRIFVSPTRLSALSEGAVARARHFILSNRVAEFYGKAAHFIDRSQIIGSRSSGSAAQSYASGHEP